MDRRRPDQPPAPCGLAGERHVKIGHGRNYADVPPIRGVYQGRVASTLDVSVHMTRLEPQESLRA
jgi:transglutaminase-like putative cysteine protease